MSLDKLNNWVEIPSLKPVDFSGFDFYESQGEYKDTLIYINNPKLSRKLFVWPMESDSVHDHSVLPVCTTVKVANSRKHIWITPTMQCEKIENQQSLTYIVNWHFLICPDMHRESCQSFILLLHIYCYYEISMWYFMTLYLTGYQTFKRSKSKCIWMYLAKIKLSTLTCCIFEYPLRY